MVAESPYYDLTWYSNPYGEDIPHPTSTVADIGLPHRLCGDLSVVFRDMRYLSYAITFRGQLDGTLQSYTPLDLVDFSTTRNALEYRLLSFELLTSTSEITVADYQIEICRLAALVYVKRALPLSLTSNALVHDLKGQIMECLRGMEASCSIAAEPQPFVLTWALFMAGILAMDEEDGDWIAPRIARGARAAGITTWVEMESRLDKICWMDKLNTPACKSLWMRVESLDREYWAAQICSMGQTWAEEESVFDW